MSSAVAASNAVRRRSPRGEVVIDSPRGDAVTPRAAVAGKDEPHLEVLEALQRRECLGAVAVGPAGLQLRARRAARDQAHGAEKIADKDDVVLAKLEQAGPVRMARDVSNHRLARHVDDRPVVESDRLRHGWRSEPALAQDMHHEGCRRRPVQVEGEVAFGLVAARVGGQLGIGGMEMHRRPGLRERVRHPHVIDVSVGEGHRTDVGSLAPQVRQRLVEVPRVPGKARVDDRQAGVSRVDDVPVHVARARTPDARGHLRYRHATPSRYGPVLFRIGPDRSEPCGSVSPSL
jgi:hypothetical protein